MTDLSNLHAPEGANEDRTRVGRGPGSGTGKTCGRGQKGQKARSGNQIPAWFEGGQMPLYRRLPKRGFTNPNSTECEIVNIGELNALREETITPEVLAEHGLVDLAAGEPVKVLGGGQIERAVTVRTHRVSEGARERIKQAGGTVELLEG